jgi:hypothetical protein
MAKWEYLVRVFELNTEDEVVVDYVMREYSQERFKELLEYDPLILEAWLNKCGEDGWELIKIEGVHTQGKKGDVGVLYSNGVPTWHHFYLCVFRRPGKE